MPVSQMVKHVHQSVAKESLEFLAALRRYNYVTPTSYLEVLSTYRNVLNMKRLEVGTLKNRLQVMHVGGTLRCGRILHVAVHEKQNRAYNFSDLCRLSTCTVLVNV